MGPRLRGDRGQFFTPKSLVRAMIEVLNPAMESKVVDPACGTGGFLMETHTFQGARKTVHAPGKLIGFDKDRDLCRLAEATLEIATPGRGMVFNVNSLDIESLKAVPFDYSPFDADYVLTNPPFGTKIKITDRKLLGQFSFGHEWQKTGEKWLEQPSIRDAQDPQILFLELCIRLLKPGGKLAIVLPEGVFGNESLGYVWDYIREHGQILALLDCPRTTFQPSTDTKTNVLFFERKENGIQVCSRKQSTWTAVALTCGHDRRGRDKTALGERYPDDLLELGSGFQDRASNGRWQFTTIKNPYYLVPRYYDGSALKELEAEARKLNAELMSLEEMMREGYLLVRKGQEVGAEAYGTGDIPFIRTSDISNYEISIDPTRSVSEEIYSQYADQQRLAPGNILMVTDGRYRIGRTAILTEHNYRCVVQSHIKILSITKKSPISAIELLYLLSTPSVQHQIRNLVFIQSTLGNLGSRFQEIRIPIPARSEIWLERLNRFRTVIEERARLLQELQGFEDVGYEV
jgi:type I restriction enzyme M protein